MATDFWKKIEFDNKRSEKIAELIAQFFVNRIIDRIIFYRASSASLFEKLTTNDISIAINKEFNYAHQSLLNNEIDRKGVTPEKINIFKEKLKFLLMDKMIKSQEVIRLTTTDIPEGILEEARKNSGMSSLFLIWPQNTLLECNGRGFQYIDHGNKWMRFNLEQEIVSNEEMSAPIILK